MTSLDVIDTDAFLDMPQSSQLLYFHLNARADDDGFVANPKRIMRDMGSQEDDLKLLAVKKFIIIFDDGVCVLKHWRINNFIRKDIYKETKYLNLKSTLFIRPNGAYTLNSDLQAIPVPRGHYTLEDVDDTLTKRQLSIDKYSIGKIREDKISFVRFWEEYDKKIGKLKSEKKWNGLSLKDQMAIFEYLPTYKRAQPNKRYRKNPETFLNNRSWEDEIVSVNEKTMVVDGIEIYGDDHLQELLDKKIIIFNQLKRTYEKSQ
jgi:hypothetical protein